MNLMTSKITRGRVDFSHILDNQMQYFALFFVILSIYVCPVAVVNFLCLRHVLEQKVMGFCHCHYMLLAITLSWPNVSTIFNCRLLHWITQQLICNQQNHLTHAQCCRLESEWIIRGKCVSSLYVAQM